MFLGWQCGEFAGDADVCCNNGAKPPLFFVHPLKGYTDSEIQEIFARGIRNPRALESVILPKEIPLKIGIRNPHAQRQDSESMKDGLVANDIGLVQFWSGHNDCVSDGVGRVDDICWRCWCRQNFIDVHFY